MALFITQCPHCRTLFRTSITQLQSAEGMVRCGACLKVFAADDNIVPSAELQTVNITPPTENERQLRLDEEQDEAPGEDNDDAIFTLDLADSLPNRIDPSISENEPFWELLDDEFANESQAEVQPSTPGKESPKSPDPDAAPDIPEPDPGINDPGMDNPDTDPPTLPREETAFLADLLDAEHDLHSQAGFSAENLAATRDLADPLELHWEKPDGEGRNVFLMWFVALLLLAGLFAQFLWYNKDRLGQNEEWRPWLERLCTTIGCELTPLVNIRAISSENLLVRSHPEIANALSVNLVFRNNAGFPQPFPILNLRFTDVNNALVAERQLLPAEYLPTEVADLELMPAGAPIQIALDILDPGPDAVNYEVSFSPMFARSLL